MAQQIDPYRDYLTKTELSDSTFFDGVMKFDDSLRINGKYKGSVVAKGLLVLGPKAQIKGNIECDEVIIGGELRGNVTAHKRLELFDSARLYGDIKTAKLKIADGVVFEGKCEMTKVDNN